MQKEITSKEKLENEIKIMQEKYEKDKKTKDQLGIEISTLKQNLKEEIITIKEKLESEIKTVKETTELSKCKELLQLEHLNNTQIQSELITCKENLQQVELTTCKQINDELLIYKEKCDIKNQKQYSKTETKPEIENIKIRLILMTLFVVIDISSFIIFFRIFKDKQYKDFNKIFAVTYIFEVIFDIQFLFIFNSIYFISIYTIIFVASLAFLAFFAYEFYTQIIINKSLVALIAYFLSTYTFKYTFIAFNNKSLTVWQFLINLDFILESLAIVAIILDEEVNYILLISFSKLILFICCSNINYFSILLSHIGFLFFIIELYDESRKYLRSVFSLIATLVKFFFFIFESQNYLWLYKIVFIIELIILLVEISVNVDFLYAVIQICFTLLLINARVFMLIFISLFALFSIIISIMSINIQNINIHNILTRDNIVLLNISSTILVLVYIIIMNNFGSCF